MLNLPNYHACVTILFTSFSLKAGDDLLLLNDRVDRTDIFKWQGVERPIRLLPLWQWLRG